MYLQDSHLGAPSDDARLRRLCAHLHGLGPRSVYEFVRAIGAGRDIVLTLEGFRRLDASVVKYLGGDRMPNAEARQ